MSVAAPDVMARTEVATGVLSDAAPPGLLPNADRPSEHTSTRTSAPLCVAARRGLVWDIFSILRVAPTRGAVRHALTLVWATSSLARGGDPIKRAPHNACGQPSVLSKSCRRKCGVWFFT